MKSIILLCGVPGSGKTWVCKQLTHKFNYISNDDYIKSGDPVRAAVIAARSGDKTVILDCPFKQRETMDRLKGMGMRTKSIFIIESPVIVKQRYEQREKRPIPPMHLARAKSIVERAKEWHAKTGTSSEILEFLKNVPDAL